jgi:hypothetical protein
MGHFETAPPVFPKPSSKLTEFEKGSNMKK